MEYYNLKEKEHPKGQGHVVGLSNGKLELLTQGPGSLDSLGLFVNKKNEINSKKYYIISKINENEAKEIISFSMYWKGLQMWI